MDHATIIPDAEDRTIARWLGNQLGARQRVYPDRMAISLPGGSTPFPILAAMPKDQVDWSRIDVWPGDDRIVPEDHPASNVGRIRALLEPLGAHVVALEEGAQPPHFALAWLGMGLDGHIASLFPNTDPQADAGRAVIRLTPDPLPPEAPFDRLSLTIPALVDTDQLLFVARGEQKAALFRQAVAGAHDLPVARLLAAATCPVTCFT